MSRPICVNCGNPYGRRETEVRIIKFRAGDPTPPYDGNGRVLKTKVWTATGTGSARESFSRPMINYQVGDALVKYEVWFEKWEGGCRPFCTNRCAIEYARKAFRRYGAVK